LKGEDFSPFLDELEAIRQEITSRRRNDVTTHVKRAEADSDQGGFIHRSLIGG
jgi:hypothetical protein